MAGSQNRRCAPLGRGRKARAFRYIFPAVLLWLAVVAPAARAQEGPYFVTYSQHMEEPGDLEIGFKPTTAKPGGGDRFYSGLMEFEYGATRWWTTEFYLEGQSTLHDSSVFSGYRIENRFRVLPGRHRVNPLLYAEYENTSAGKTLTHVVGFDGQAGALEPNAIARRDVEREMETSLILGSDFQGWNVSENFIAEKNLAGEPWEFGYALGLGHRIGHGGAPPGCSLCPRNFSGGLELYGGLGTADRLTLGGTSHYLAPVLAWSSASGLRFKISPGFGITRPAYPFILRLGVSYEFSGFGGSVRRLFSHGAS